MRPKTSAFGSMIDTVPIDRFIALANDDAAGSSVTSPPNLRARCLEPHMGDRHARAFAGHGREAWMGGGVRVLVVRVRAHPVLDIEPRVVVAGDEVPVAGVLEEARDELEDGLPPPVSNAAQAFAAPQAVAESGVGRTSARRTTAAAAARRTSRVLPPARMRRTACACRRSGGTPSTWLYARASARTACTTPPPPWEIREQKL